jgi:hypothetical protein
MAEHPKWDYYWYKKAKEAKDYHDYLLPLCILQLDPADRAVLKIAGTLANLFHSKTV